MSENETDNLLSLPGMERKGSPTRDVLTYHIEEIKRVLGTTKVAILAMKEDGSEVDSLVSQMADIELVYVIQCLKDIRRMRVNRTNET